MDWLDSVFDLDGWGEAISSFYDDSGLDTLVSGVSNLFSDGGIIEGVESVFGGLGQTASNAVNFTLGGLFGGDSKSLGMTDSLFPEDSTSSPEKVMSQPQGLIGKATNWVQQNPSTAKLASGLISGAAQGYFENKKLDQNQKQFDARIAAEQKYLRDRYDYEVDAKKRDRDNLAKDYMTAYGAK